MSFEVQNAETAKTTLEVWFEKMSDADRAVIEADIFNDTDTVPLEVLLGAVKSDEKGRTFMMLFNKYLTLKESLRQKAEGVSVEDVNDVKNLVRELAASALKET